VANKMKLLIAYDGSSSADMALEDLLRAGLPADADAIVISVADIFMPRAEAPEGFDAETAMPGHGSHAVQRRLEHASHALEEARRWAANANTRLRAQFPSWKVRTEVCGHSPAWAIVEKADEWTPDLVVLGSHNRSGLDRWFLGSVSQTVLTEAHGSVRIGRARLVQQPWPVRILIGVDGSAGAAQAIAAVAKRNWPRNSEAHLVAVLDRTMSTILDWADNGFQDERSWLEDILASATAKLEAAGLNVSALVKPGIPKDILLEEAERLRMDCIFLGARGLRGLERTLLGSVSTAVASRAPCSVEIVRLPVSSRTG